MNFGASSVDPKRIVSGPRYVRDAVPGLPTIGPGSIQGRRAFSSSDPASSASLNKPENALFTLNGTSP